MNDGHDNGAAGDETSGRQEHSPHADPAAGLRRTTRPVVLISEWLWSHYGERLRAAGDIDTVLFVPGQRLSAEDLSRVTIACMSGDLYPESTGAFMRVCLDAPNLEWFQSFSAGVDHPVFGMLQDNGARLTTASGAAATPIAHHVMLCLLALAHDLPGFALEQQQRIWRLRQLDDLEQRTVGVIGLGPIGLEVARLTTAFGMNTIGMRRTVQGTEPCETWTFDRLDELFGRVDDLVLAVPLTAETRHMIGQREFDLMRLGSRLVNVGRGELLDEAALIAALQSGHLAGAGLDVFTTEPLPTDSPLWAMPNVIITPHTSGETPIAMHRAIEIFVDNLGRFLRGTPLVNEVAR